MQIPQPAPRDDRAGFEVQKLFRYANKSCFLILASWVYKRLVISSVLGHLSFILCPLKERFKTNSVTKII